MQLQFYRSSKSEHLITLKMTSSFLQAADESNQITT